MVLARVGPVALKVRDAVHQKEEDGEDGVAVEHGRTVAVFVVVGVTTSSGLIGLS